MNIKKDNQEKEDNMLCHVVFSIKVSVLILDFNAYPAESESDKPLPPV